MSTCPSKNVHSLYIDNELSPSLRHNFEKHLSTCENCTKQIKQYSTLRNDLQSLNSEYDIDSGYSRLKNRMDTKTQVSVIDPFSFIIKFSPVFAAVAVIAVFFPFVNNTFHNNTQTSSTFFDNSFLLPSLDSSHIAPLQEKGVIIDEEMTLSRINSDSAVLYTITFDASKFTEVDVFKPSVLKDDNLIDIILFDSPAVVLSETDRFGLSNPVFLLRE